LIRTLVFDFGNVVGLFDHGRTIQRLASKTTLPPTELALMLFGSPLNDDFECGRLSTSQYIDAVRLNARLECDDEEFHRAFVEIFQHHPPIESLIPKLRGHYRLVLASNTNAAHYDYLRTMFHDTLACFDHVIVSHEIGARKPRAEFFTAAQNHMHAAPGECLFIDDLPTNITAAEAHGWHGIVYTGKDDLFDRLRAFGIEVPA